MIKKINSIIYNKLLLQAEEAKDQNLTKLASDILLALGDAPEDHVVKYSFSEMEDDVNSGLWEVVSCILKYYDMESVDAEKLNSIIELYSSKFIQEITEFLNKENVKVGPLEPDVLGQSK